MRIGQFWRLLNFMRLLIIRFIARKILPDMESMKGARKSKKIEARVLQAAYSALSRHKFVGGTI